MDHQDPPVTAATGQRRPGGRSARVRQAVLDATVATMIERGFDQLNIADIAARAGVHETSIYRRWRTRENLVVDALLANSEQAVPIPDTGSVRDDLMALFQWATARLTSPLGAALLRMAVLAVDHPQMAAGRAVFWTSHLERARIIIRRGIERGELPEDADPHLVLQALVAPLYMRLLVTGEPIEDELPQRLADLLLDGLRRR
jgi:AcrR family transcriptional regulator